MTGIKKDNKATKEIHKTGSKMNKEKPKDDAKKEKKVWNKGKEYRMNDMLNEWKTEAVENDRERKKNELNKKQGRMKK